MGRKEKYKAKLDPEVIGKRYDATKELAVRKQTGYFKDAAELESKVKAICNDISSIQIHFYIAFAEEYAKTPTIAERNIIFTKWAMRGLSWFYLLQVAMKISGDVPELAGEGVFPATAAYYSFHVRAGPTAFDYSGNKNNGTITGASWTTGKIGNCLSFNGIGDFVTVLDHASLNFGINDFTISAWINTTAANNFTDIVSKYNNDTWKGYSLGIGDNGNIPVFYIAPVGRPDTHVDAVTAIDDGAWHHIVGTKSASEIRIYVDSVLENSGALVGDYDVSTVSDLIIGAAPSTPEYYFNGLIDELIIFPRALTAEEILTYYNATK